MSRHAQLPQQSTKKIVYNFNIIITTPEGQSLHDLYIQIQQEGGTEVVHELLDRSRQGEAGKPRDDESDAITCKQTGLPALFGRRPSVGANSVSGLAEFWQFDVSFSQVVLVQCHLFAKAVEWF